MMTSTGRAIAALLLMLGMTATQAAIVAVNSPTPVEAGSSFTVTVEASAFGDGTAPSLGAYDLTLSYDPLLLKLTGSLFGTALGASIDAGTPVSGSVGMSQVSLEAPTVLDTSQPGAFTLFALTFESLGTGTSTLSLASNGPFSDADGNVLVVDLSGQSVTVVSPVPLPAAGWLLLSGLVPFRALRRRHSRRRAAAVV
jgi:hypothetical protein